MRKHYLTFLCFFACIMTNAQIINIPNIYLKSKLTVQSTVYGYARNANGASMIVDINNNGEIEVSEALNVYELYIGGPMETDFTGLEHFINLRELWCNSSGAYNLDVSGMTHLQRLDCQYNNFTSLDLSGKSELQVLFCQNNQLQSINLTGCTSLFTFIANDNQLTSLDTTSLTSLNYLNCDNNMLTSLNLSGFTTLNRLECMNNNLINLNVSGAVNLKKLNCGGNSLTSLDVLSIPGLEDIQFGYNPIASIDLTGLNQLDWVDLSQTQLTTMDFSFMPLLQMVICDYCPLETIDTSLNPVLGEIDCNNTTNLRTLFMKNGKLNGFVYHNSSGLEYICQDESEYYYDILPESININSYCSFVPGGAFYTINGNAHYDADMNGCDAGDLTVPNLKFNITNGTTSGSFFPNASGYYDLPVSAGTHTMAPVLEHPEYYNITPATAQVSFPQQASPATQDFCIVPNALHNDLEVTLIPLNQPVPGFTAAYKVIYKNNGTAPVSGTVHLSYNEDQMVLLQAEPSATQSTAALSWDFSNLMPFETAEIEVSFTINTPMAPTPVNMGDIISHTVSFVNAAADETPEDNNFTLEQIVTGSFDPNDKTCLEGDFIPMSDDGQYIHYLIRFENTGTANAQNVVVKDVIDTTYLDPATLTPISSNYSFITRITDNNKVEFIFENINLPFDDANNDGYILFKIKTKPAIVLGTTFLNTASIYFDYNFPVVTEPAAVTVSVPLGISDVENKYGFAIYPNPVRDILNISSKTNVNINAMEIYNILGQQILRVKPAFGDNRIDVSGLTTGNYVIKVVSDCANWTTKFVKE